VIEGGIIRWCAGKEPVATSFSTGFSVVSGTKVNMASIVIYR
jgi:hypothetical protein